MQARGAVSIKALMQAVGKADLDMITSRRLLDIQMEELS